MPHRLSRRAPGLRPRRPGYPACGQITCVNRASLAPWQSPKLAPTDEIHSRASPATSSSCAPDKGGFAAIGGTLATTAACGGQEERGGEAEDGHEADEAATVVEG